MALPRRHLHRRRHQVRVRLQRRLRVLLHFRHNALAACREILAPIQIHHPHLALPQTPTPTVVPSGINSVTACVAFLFRARNRPQLHHPALRASLRYSVDHPFAHGRTVLRSYLIPVQLRQQHPTQWSTNGIALIIIGCGSCHTMVVRLGNQLAKSITQDVSTRIKTSAVVPSEVSRKLV